MIIDNNISSAKFQALLRLYLLQFLIPADGHWQPWWSLALDAALVGLEGA